MSNVTLDIAGRRYTVACAPGEEAHVAMLGASIDRRLASLPSVAGQSEARTLLYAALLLADELHEAGRTPVAAPSAPAADPVPLEKLADRLESLAARLEDAA